MCIIVDTNTFHKFKNPKIWIVRGTVTSHDRTIHLYEGIHVRGAIPSTCVFTSTTVGLPESSA